MGERVEFTNSNEPSLVDYQVNYYIPYGDNPKVVLYQVDELGNVIERTEKPYFQKLGGVLDSIIFGTLDEVISGYILISR